MFDDDTRLLFATSFDGTWDAYMEDFASKPLSLFDAVFRHVEGYDGAPDVATVEGVHPRRAGHGRGVRPKLPRDGEGDPQGRTDQPGVPAGARQS